MKAFKINEEEGVLIVREITWSEVSGGINHRYNVCDVLIDPEIDITNGVVTIFGKRHSYTKIINYDKSWSLMPVNTNSLVDTWKDDIFYNDNDIILKKVKTYSGIWPIRKKKVENDVEHLVPQAYLCKKYKLDYIRTSNFRIHYLGLM